MGFVLHLAGKKLLHTGDILNTAQLAPYDLQDDHLDVAFFEVVWLMEKAYPRNGIAAIVNILGAEWIVPMHPSPYRFGSEELMATL